LFRAAHGRARIGRQRQRQRQVPWRNRCCFKDLAILSGLRKMAHVLRRSGKQKTVELKQEEHQTMISDLVTYALLASIFVVTGLRMFVEKPNKLKEILIARKRIKREK
jgi:hypothetical protein